MRRVGDCRCAFAIWGRPGVSRVFRGQSSGSLDETATHGVLPLLTNSEERFVTDVRLASYGRSNRSPESDGS